MRLENLCLLSVVVVFLLANTAVADELPVVAGVERQPLQAATQRVVEALRFAGSPLDPDVIRSLEQAWKADDKDAVDAIQRVLDPL